jgi:glycosyltransferase involved in cell wall biosynthesis
MVHLSVVVPVYNESSLIKELVKRVKASIQLITEDYEIILVDDGSNDGTWQLIENESLVEKRIKGLKFSRNFGHHYAITAGIHNSNGEWVVVMDGDLQDRPEVIPNLYKSALNGFDVVFVSRVKRPESKVYLIIQKSFYLILNLLSGLKFDSSQANFSIISKKVVEAYKNFPENSRFYPSTVKWLGFKRTSISAEHGRREAGKASYTVRKRIKLAMDIILSFAQRPLRLAIYLGISISFFSILGAIWILFASSKWGYEVVGWSSLMTSIFFLGGVILVVLGIIGIYIGQVFQEVKTRPLYIISEKID